MTRLRFGGKYGSLFANVGAYCWV